MIWRPVIARIATLSEIERDWSLMDLLDAHDALDVREELAREAEKRAREAGK
jgi:hypothetical protein